MVVDLGRQRLRVGSIYLFSRHTCGCGMKVFLRMLVGLSGIIRVERLSKEGSWVTRSSCTLEIGNGRTSDGPNSKARVHGFHKVGGRGLRSFPREMTSHCRHFISGTRCFFSCTSHCILFSTLFKNTLPAVSTNRFEQYFPQWSSG